jgi:hypothetical protein
LARRFAIRIQIAEPAAAVSFTQPSARNAASGFLIVETCRHRLIVIASASA